jgi:hypothetical protein
MIRKPGLDLLNQKRFHLPVRGGDQVFSGFEFKGLQRELSLFRQTEVACFNNQFF